MFQRVNILEPFTRNPNLGSDETAPVPTLRQSQRSLQHSNDAKLKFIKVAIVILLILLLGFGVFIYFRIRLYETCEDCIKFEELKRIAEKDPDEAINYVHTKVASVTTRVEEPEEELVRGEMIELRLQGILKLREKIEELIKVNSTFSEELNKALSAENELKTLRESYGNSAKSLESSLEITIQDLQVLYEQSKQRQELEQRIGDLKTQIQTKKSTLAAEKAKAQQTRKELEDFIAEILKNAHVKDAQEIPQTILSKESKVEERERVKKTCENELPQYNQRLLELSLKYQDEINFADDLELQHRQSKWIEHVLRTIDGFTFAKTELNDTRVNQAREGRKIIEKTVAKLQKKEEELLQPVSITTETTSVEVEGDTEVTEGASKQTTVIKTVQNTTTVIHTQRIQAIEKDQLLLRKWVRNQFDILNLSTNEIRNITNTIESLREAIKEQSKEYEHYAELRNNSNHMIQAIISDLEIVEIKKNRCEEELPREEELIEREKKEIEKLKEIEAELRKSLEQKKNYEGNLAKIEEIYNEKLDNLKKEQEALEDQIKKSMNEQVEKEMVLKTLTFEMNEIIAAEPQTKDVEKVLSNYRVHVQHTNQAYQSLIELLDEIKTVV